MEIRQNEWVRFRKAPLKLVIGQIQVPIMTRFGQMGFIADFQDAIRSNYPITTRDTLVKYQLSSAGIAPEESRLAWRFSSVDQQWSVIVSEIAVTLETRNYHSMQDFLTRFRHVLTCASESLEIQTRTRLGLRYLNEMRYPEAESLATWCTLLKSELVGLDLSTFYAGEIDHTVHEMQVNRADGMFTVRHGLLSGNVVEPLPKEKPATGKFYLIDLDYYENKAYDLDIEATLQQMHDYNDVMSRFFRWTLSEQLYTYLEPTHAQRT